MHMHWHKMVEPVTSNMNNSFLHGTTQDRVM